MQVLSKELGYSLEVAREMIWKMIAGDVETSEELQAIVESLCLRFESFRHYFAKCQLLKEKNCEVNSMVDIYITPLTTMVKERIGELLRDLSQDRHKFLYTVNGYIYIMYQVGTTDIRLRDATAVMIGGN